MRLCVGNSIVIIVGTTQGNDVLKVDSPPEYLPSLFALPIYKLFRRTSGPGLRPGLDQRTGLPLRTRSRRAAEAWVPCPSNQRVFTDVMDQLFDLAAAVAAGVLDLGADLGERFSLPCHLARGEVPFRG